jgi:uncharacterized protein (TIGR02246 family)
MSEENVEVVRRSFDAWNSRDAERILLLYTEDAVLHSATKDVVGKTYRGKDALRRFLEELRDDMSSWGWKVEELIDAGDRVVTFHSVITTGPASGIEVTRPLAGVYEVRNGLIATEWIFLDRNEALEAAGLSE